MDLNSVTAAAGDQPVPNLGLRLAANVAGNELRVGVGRVDRTATTVEERVQHGEPVFRAHGPAEDVATQDDRAERQ